MVMLLSLYYYSPCIVIPMTGKQKLLHGYKLGRGHSFILSHLFGTWPRRKEKTNKKSVSCQKRHVTMPPKWGKKVLPNSTKPREPPACKGILFTCLSILINVQKNTLPPASLYVSMEQWNSLLLRREKCGGTLPVSAQGGSHNLSDWWVRRRNWAHSTYPLSECFSLHQSVCLCFSFFHV